MLCSSRTYGEADAKTDVLSITYVDPEMWLKLEQYNCTACFGFCKQSSLSGLVHFIFQGNKILQIRTTAGQNLLLVIFSSLAYWSHHGHSWKRQTLCIAFPVRGATRYPKFWWHDDHDKEHLRYPGILKFWKTSILTAESEVQKSRYSMRLLYY